MPKFRIEQIALYPADTEAAFELLAALGLTEWARDHVVARGNVFSTFRQQNEADLAFNYEAGNGNDPAGKALELEVLNYTAGDHWIARNEAAGVITGDGCVSHLGMHVTEEELAEFDAVFQSFNIGVAQSVETQSHTNPHIKDSRRYKYVIYDTREIIGTDLKFIVRLPYTPDAHA